MKIACLGWGSLIWKPDGLPAGEWQTDAPSLPVEFARQSTDGRLTLVLLDEGQRVPVLYAILKESDLNGGMAALAIREKCARRRIGYWASSAPAGIFAHAQVIGNWARDRAMDAVVWTALPPKFGNVEGRVPTAEEAASYLAGLTGETRRIAKEYVCKAHAQVRTPY